MLRTPYDRELRKGMDVVICPDLMKFDRTEAPQITDSMLTMAGKRATVKLVCGYIVHLNEFPCSWLPKWLMVEEPDEEPNIELDLADVL